MAADPAKSESNSASPAQGISEFLGRVLDQLSLSSWLPSTLLACDGAVLWKLAGQTHLDLGLAIEQLTSDAWSALVGLLFGIIVAAVILQAFEFEIIRTLEGYVGAVLGLHWLAAWRIRHFVRRRAKIEARIRKLQIETFALARVKMLPPRGPFEARHLVSR